MASEFVECVEVFPEANAFLSGVGAGSVSGGGLGGLINVVPKCAGAYKLNCDLHRSGGLWIWGVIVIVAFTSFSINLYREVFCPVMSKLSTTTPGADETLKPAPFGSFIEPRIGFATAIEIARKEAVLGTRPRPEASGMAGISRSTACPSSIPATRPGPWAWS